ncbi:uncharacterized protein LOC117815513 [Xyrichtys novacula]|uniref:Uncharacterized protein LOC117815513 n=1 Tax=Xyrichtys novacula TaxID=13765 RepID=A0AAV1EYG1_XYRNO|nr:uncharacterized protein LOC117815513 [Xyrichtys novacula]
MFASVFVLILGQPVLGRPTLSGPSVVLAGTVEDFECELQVYPKNETILLQLYKVGHHEEVLAEYTLLSEEVAFFPKVVKLELEGNLECMAKAQNNSEIEPTVSSPHYLKVIVPVENPNVFISSGLQEFFAGRTLDLRCNVTSGNHVDYTWLLNGRPVSLTPRHKAVEGQLLITSTTSEDSGVYMCVATNYYNVTEFFTFNSSEIIIRVKDPVSKPDISFNVSKDGSIYYAMVTCQSMRGTPPVNFTLFNGTAQIDSLTAHETKATFRVSLVLGQHLGQLQCKARNENRTVESEWIPLEVVPVRGPVTLQYDSDLGEDYAVIGLRLYCKAAKGTHPQYQWFLNETLIQEQGSFSSMVHEPRQSVLLLSVGGSSAGTYRCEVSDSFDNITAISSRGLYLDREVLNRLPLMVVVVVFGSFMTVILVVSVCCCYGVLFRKREYGENSLWSAEMVRRKVAYEDELDVSEYQEDVDLVQTARGGDSDQTSEDSVDEWPQILKRRRTLEDEAEDED